MTMQPTYRIPLAVFAVGGILHLTSHWGGFLPQFADLWLAVALGALAAILRWWQLPFLVAAGIAFEVGVLGQSNLAELLWLFSVAALIGRTTGHSIGRLLRAYERTSQQLALLIDVQNALSFLNTRHSVLEALPNLLGQHGEGHVSVWAVEGDRLRMLSAFGLHIQEHWQPLTEGVLGQALRERVTLHVPNVAQEPNYIKPPANTSHAALVLPLFERNDITALLNIERPRAFLTAELNALERLAQTVSQQLTRISQQRQLLLLANLNQSLQAASNTKEIAERSLDLLLRFLEVDAGEVLQQQGSTLIALATVGPLAQAEQRLLRTGIARNTNLAWEVQRENRPLYCDSTSQDERVQTELELSSALAIVLHPIPLPHAEQARFVLKLFANTPHRWRLAEKEALAQATQAIGLALHGALEQQRVQLLLSLQRRLIQSAPETAYAQILQAAVGNVPGADSGSLLIRENQHYVFRATVGFDLSALREHRFDENQQLSWYNQPTESWYGGLPRLLSVRSDRIGELSQLSAGQNPIATSVVESIKANLCMPIVYRGEVLAILNLDNLQDPHAFGEDSLKAAEVFGAPIAALLHELRYRDLLKNAALTDALTGLPNRRAFDDNLSEEFERAKRYGTPLSLMLIDLTGFKQINDRLGHAQGDQALIKVAQMLQTQRRNGDKQSRWGGDEFAVILTHTPLSGAVSAAQRYARCIASINVGELGLGANIGVASYPQEVSSPEALLQLADTRMYEAKAAKEPVRFS